MTINGREMKWSAVETDNNFHFMDMSTGFKFTLFDLERAVGREVPRTHAVGNLYVSHVGAFLSWIEKEWA